MQGKYTRHIEWLSKQTARVGVICALLMHFWSTHLVTYSRIFHLYDFCFGFFSFFRLVFACVHVCGPRACSAHGGHRGRRSPWTAVTELRDPLCVCWELNPSPPKESLSSPGRCRIQTTLALTAQGSHPATPNTQDAQVRPAPLHSVFFNTNLIPYCLQLLHL